jgi:hypothetical protein
LHMSLSRNNVGGVAINNSDGRQYQTWCNILFGTNY